MKTKIENKCPRVEWCINCNMRIEQGKQTNIECMGAIQRVATVQFGEILSWCMKETFFMVRAINLILSIFDWIRSDRDEGERYHFVFRRNHSIWFCLFRSFDSNIKTSHKSFQSVNHHLCILYNSLLHAIKCDVDDVGCMFAISIHL